MTELTIGQLIKLILGILVVIAVIIGIVVFFKDKIIDFFRNLPGAEPSGFFLNLIK